MAGKQKKRYMREYNQRSYVKAKKAEYMRKKRAEEDKLAARRLVQLFLDFGFEELAHETAVERAPEMLATVKSRAPRKQSR